MGKLIDINEKIANKKNEERQKLARYLLRTCKRNGTPISTDSARTLFADAGWEYKENSIYLEIPDEE